jgi:hypothetical protein
MFARGNTENMAAVFVSDGTPDTLRKKRKLVFRWLFAHPAGSPDYLGSAFTDQSLLFL